MPAELELEAVRDERDLCRSLLLAPAPELASFFAQALQSIERIRSLLRLPTRESAAFRGKIGRLLEEVSATGQAAAVLHLASVQRRVADGERSLREIQARSDISGNDLLPAMVLLEDLCSHVAIAADLASVHVPGVDGNSTQDEHVDSATQPQLALALRRSAATAAAECDKRITLVTLGFEDIPSDWHSAIFDVLSQLVRNAVEHGIESRDVRSAHNKPEDGTLVAEFHALGELGFELDFHDDGQGLDAEQIAKVAVRQGLLSAEAVTKLDSRRLASLIFQPGLTTAADDTRRGIGMQIVRDQIRGLGGQIQVSAKPGRFTRYRIRLPPIAATLMSATLQRA